MNLRSPVAAVKLSFVVLLATCSTMTGCDAGTADREAADDPALTADEKQKLMRCGTDGEGPIVRACVTSAIRPGDQPQSAANVEIVYFGRFSHLGSGNVFVWAAINDQWDDAHLLKETLSGGRSITLQGGFTAIEIGQRTLGELFEADPVTKEPTRLKKTKLSFAFQAKGEQEFDNNGYGPDGNPRNYNIVLGDDP